MACIDGSERGGRREVDNPTYVWGTTWTWARQLGRIAYRLYIIVDVDYQLESLLHPHPIPPLDTSTGRECTTHLTFHTIKWGGLILHICSAYSLCLITSRIRFFFLLLSVCFLINLCYALGCLCLINLCFAVTCVCV